MTLCEIAKSSEESSEGCVIPDVTDVLGGAQRSTHGMAEMAARGAVPGTRF